MANPGTLHDWVDDLCARGRYTFSRAEALSVTDASPAAVKQTLYRLKKRKALGLGLMFVGITALRPWSTSIPLVIFYFMTGALAARLLGLVVDGTVPEQRRAQAD